MPIHNYTILSTPKLNGFERNEIITDTWLRAYRAPFPTSEEAAGAIGWAKGFATGAHVFEMPDPATTVLLARLSAIAIWGAADRTLQSHHFLPLFRQAFPEGEVVRLPDVGHYSPEDTPLEVSRSVSALIASGADTGAIGGRPLTANANSFQ